MFTAETFRRMWPHARPELIASVVAQAPTIFPRYGLGSALTVAHFMAQCSQECGCDTEGIENLSYSAARLLAEWPKHFNQATALAYAHQPQNLANYIYEPPCHMDLGNRPGTDDGWRFRGHGGSQATGRAAYERLAKVTGLPLLDQPELANDPAHWLEVACADFVQCGCLTLAQQDDVRGVTHHLNGGYTGLAEREKYLTQWKAALAAEGHQVDQKQNLADGVLRYGDKGEPVAALQRRLAELGYAVGAADGDFGAATRGMVLTFQADVGLATTGEVNAATQEALTRGLPKPVSESRATATVKDLREQGSETVAAADNVSTLGKVAIGGSVCGGLHKIGAFTALSMAADKWNEIKPVIDALQDMVNWGGEHWYFGAALVGCGAWLFARKVIARRLADHRRGLNMGK